MADTYTASQVAALARVALHTVHRWAAEYQQHLSPGATPAKGRQRNFTPNDLSVLLLVAELKNEGATHADVHAALEAGQRAAIPDATPDEIKALVTDDRRELIAQNQMLLQKVATLEAEIEDLKGYRDENIALKAQLAKEREIGRLEGELEALRRQIGQEDK